MHSRKESSRKCIGDTGCGFAYQSISSDVRTQMPSTKAMKKTIQRRRCAVSAAPSQPASRASIVIPEAYQTYGRQEQFLLYDSGLGDDDRLLTFGRQSNMAWSALMKHLYADGTFKITPPLFAHVYILMAERDGFVLQVLYAPLPDKRETTYRRMFEAVKGMWPQLSPDSVAMDFEQHPNIWSSKGCGLNCLPTRRETEVEEFLNKHPECDGRGVVIAVLDTGVDPSSPGMQKTSDGRTKVVDIVDFTGAGDVDTSTVRQAENGILIGLTGRKLKVPSSWRNPSGKYHLGVKAIYELYPESLKKRIQNEKKKKYWDPVHRLAIADMNKQIELFELQFGRDRSKIPANARLKRKNLDAGLKLLKTLDSNYDDSGPTADCIVFHDGINWVACLDTSFTGNLESCRLMASYRIRNEYSTISESDIMTYSFNIHNNGEILEIACTGGLHGTHVACIAAGCFPDAPHRNGIAPGAQIVSLQIGDSRLKNLETGTALLRALAYCIEKRVHVINYSYAEPVSFQNSGKIIDAINDAVYNHGIVFVGSSGNNGPCLSTVTSPGGSCSACLGISAYVSPQMRTKLYSLRESVGPTLFPWSSRGPCSDGWLGTTICAPGAAITSTPRWTLNNRQLLNGTSMSSPNVAGAVALLISGLKVENASYSPFVIRLALANTAKKLDQYSVFEAGRGLMQIQQALEYLLRCSKLLDVNMHYKVTLDDRNRGLYLRELYEVQHPCEVAVSVEAVFNDNTKPFVRFQFSRLLALKCEAEWIKIPTHLEINSTARSFRMRVDPTRLEQDRVHYAEVLIYEADKPVLGPVAIVPITVVLPIVPKQGPNENLSFTNVPLSNSGCRRHFIHVPDGCNTAVLRVDGRKCELNSQFVVHVVQLTPDESYKQSEWYKLVRFGDESQFTFNIPVIEGRTAELCLASWWVASSELVIDYKIMFTGLKAHPEEISWRCCDPVFKVLAKCGPSSEELSPTMTFRSLCVPFKPIRSVITNLGPRDLYNDGQQCYQLLNTYEFSLDVSSTVTPLIPLVAEYLYEAEFCGFLWTIFSNHNRYILSGSYFSSRYQVKLEKGDYILMLQVRHVNEEILIDMKDLGIFIECRLSPNIQAQCYASLPEAIRPDSKKFSCRRVPAHSLTPLYFLAPAKDSLPKSFVAGCYLRGSLVLLKRDSKSSPQFPVHYHLAFKKAAKAKKKTLLGANGWKESIKDATLNEDAIKELQVTNPNEEKEHDNSELNNKPDRMDKDVSKVLRVLSSSICSSFFAGGKEKSTKDLWDSTSRIMQLVKLQDVLQFSGGNDDCLPAVPLIEEVEPRKNALTIALLVRGLIIADSLMKAKSDRFVNLDFDAWKYENRAGKEETPVEIHVGTNGDKKCSNCKNNKKEEANVSDMHTEDNLEEMPNDGVVSLKNSFMLTDLDDIFYALVRLGEPIDGSCAVFFLKHAYLYGNLFQAILIIRKYADARGHAKRFAEIEVELFREAGLLHVLNFCHPVTVDPSKI
uniref:Tripeptidyl-peptidase 2 n=1 Tax=Trichuris muris TaxID=70415 RepID=A0A5S6QUS5_TRIMR